MAIITTVVAAPIIRSIDVIESVISTSKVPLDMCGFYAITPLGTVGGRVFPLAMASPTGGIPEWTREVPGEVPATGGGKAA